ncbi:DnaJ family domain-containing protein [uncultured Desulfovibrio sp.]|uniref:DnaJ family domain-containing protein n=1 Tax=uncultured Desulfovibrio sp. TaxID=167968 RepID=UPI002609AF89|nr:DnaJ family domain-containing protein [uncultured Desulfovibrio sp.]
MSQPNPWSVIQSIAEQRIAEAQQQGAFDNLPGAGRPLQLEDDSHIPPELRMAYKVLRNAGCLPPEMQDRKDIANLADMLEQCEDEQERVRQMQKLRLLIMRAKTRHERVLHLDDEQYYDRLLDRLSRKMSAGRASREEA